MIIDVHTHIGIINNNIYTPQRLIDAMNQAGINISLVIADNHSRNKGVSTEEMVAFCRKFPKLKAVGNIDYDTFDRKQLEKLIFSLQSKDIVGVKLYPGYQDFYPFDKKLFPLYQYCESSGNPVIFHTGMLEINYPGLLKQSHPLEIDTVANTFPDLKIVMA